jgi:hypothetical protein
MRSFIQGSGRTRRRWRVRRGEVFIIYGENAPVHFKRLPHTGEPLKWLDHLFMLSWGPQSLHACALNRYLVVTGALVFHWR